MCSICMANGSVHECQGSKYFIPADLEKNHVILGAFKNLWLLQAETVTPGAAMQMRSS